MVNQIKVALDTTPLLGSPSGIGRVTESLFYGLAEQPDLDLTGFVVSYSGTSQLESKLPVGVKGKHLKFPARLTHVLWENFQFPRLGEFDIVHGVNYVVPPSKSGAELVTIHDLTAWKYPNLLSERNKSFPALVERALKRGAHVHVVSKFIASEVQSYLGLDSDRISVIYNGNSQLRSGDAASGRNLVGSNYILAIGTVEPRKDYPTLVKAMEDVWGIYPDLKLVIAGAMGWGSDELAQVVANSTKPNQIELLGYVNEETRANLLHGAELLAYPSIYEGFGLPMLEAMSAGVPVVATQIGAIAEVAGDAALLVPSGSTAGLAAGIVDVIEQDDVRSHLRSAGLRRSADFSWDTTVRQMASLYRYLASKEPNVVKS